MYDNLCNSFSAKNLSYKPIRGNIVHDFKFLSTDSSSVSTDRITMLGQTLFFHLIKIRHILVTARAEASIPGFWLEMTD
jgi:hypothetical protein